MLTVTVEFATQITLKHVHSKTGFQIMFKCSRLSVFSSKLELYVYVLITWPVRLHRRVYTAIVYIMTVLTNSRCKRVCRELLHDTDILWKVAQNRTFASQSDFFNTLQRLVRSILRVSRLVTWTTSICCKILMFWHSAWRSLK